MHGHRNKAAARFGGAPVHRVNNSGGPDRVGLVQALGDKRVQAAMSRMSPLQQQLVSGMLKEKFK